MRRRQTKLKGASLLTALVAVLIVSIMLGGLGALAVSHYSRARSDAEYAKALQLAEAGINYELRYISDNQLSTVNPVAHQAGSAYTGSVSGAPGTFSVWVTNDPDNGSAWAPPSAMLIHAIGTVNGISRRLVARGTRQSIFDIFTLYGIQTVNFNGSGSTVGGDIGTNGTMNVVDPIGNVPAPGEIYLAGGGATINKTGTNVVLHPNPLEFPTIDEIIVKNPPVGLGSTGWAWLTSTSPLNRSNPNLRTFAATGAALTPAGTRLAGAPWTGTNAQSIRLQNADFNSLGNHPSTGNKTLIIPPGDYYFTDIQLSGTRQIIVDTGGLTTGTPGLVRIWMNGSNSNDQININVSFTSTNASMFRLYYNKCTSISISGNSTYYGGFYAVRDGCTGNIQVEGGSIIYGSVLANNITVSGGSAINFPSDGIIDNPGDFSMWFGFRDGWKEVNSGGSVVFIDGTNK